MPRRSAADAARTRQAIVDRAVVVASEDGLEGLTIGRLATDLGLSKGGVLNHFVSKEELQLATVDAAVTIFRREVWDGAADAAPGRARLLAVADHWLSYLSRDVFPGGCLLTAASSEFDDRPGRVRDAIADAHGRWMALLSGEARAAVRTGDLPRRTDPDDVAFGLNAIAMGVNQARHLTRDPHAVERGWRAMRTLLGAPRARRSRDGTAAPGPAQVPVRA